MPTLCDFSDQPAINHPTPLPQLTISTLTMAPSASESEDSPTAQEKASTPPPTTTNNHTAPASVRRESARRRMPIDRLGFLTTQNTARCVPVESLENIFDNPVGSDVEEREESDLEEPVEANQVAKTKVNPPARTKGQLAVKQASKKSGKEVIIDVTQDSDEENAPVAARKPKELLLDKDGFDHPRVYFFPIGQGPKQDASAQAFACRWCPKEYLARNQSNFNPRIHCNGAVSKGSTRAPCPGRLKAISAGANLPRTAAQLAKEADKPQLAANSIVAFTKQGLFGNSTLNKLIVVWLLRSQIWAALHAHQLYLELHARVIKEIKELNSMISLVSDVWTTKGSHKAFIGISCCYINQAFVLVTRHLAIKYVSWHHNGKYVALPFANTLTKHGLHSQMRSNNFTMANELALIILSGTGTDWDVERNHHRCICHVIALILGAGLKALNVSRKMVCPEKADKAFPSLAPYIEEVKTGPKDEIIEVIDISGGV
ncbi:hypothetical protein Pst134EA_022748 [Puccinia striiformis f. sp. tritici]|uniref:hypothetical protein n=1 Tax=Puccinia striiformis f. sp. tritici TaxID=168172 RepID=UPI002008B202|nr:hypothetical protein Pst134EA_022748 [Puccinia striiformis f. sp. tritici]KAH9455273.1 hypothetical protein Pst134EA_022748 [Puccinia striiformis f. sp. tritici]